MCEKIATNTENPYLARIKAATIPSALTITLTYGTHLIKGTPEPIDSTIPTMIVAALGFPAWAEYSIRKHQKTL